MGKGSGNPLKKRATKAKRGAAAKGKKAVFSSDLRTVFYAVDSH